MTSMSLLDPLHLCLHTRTHRHYLISPHSEPPCSTQPPGCPYNPKCVWGEPRCSTWVAPSPAHYILPAPDHYPLNYLFFWGGGRFRKTGTKNWRGEWMEGTMRWRRNRMDGRNRWTVGMDRWMERQDGQDRWEYGMNHMDGKDEEEIDDKFFSFLYIFLPLIFTQFFLLCADLHHTRFIPHFFLLFLNYHIASLLGSFKRGRV